MGFKVQVLENDTVIVSRICKTVPSHLKKYWVGSKRDKPNSWVTNEPLNIYIFWDIFWIKSSFMATDDNLLVLTEECEL